MVSVCGVVVVFILMLGSGLLWTLMSSALLSALYADILIGLLVFVDAIVVLCCLWSICVSLGFVCLVSC
jgi:hypothetical protein